MVRSRKSRTLLQASLLVLDPRNGTDVREYLFTCRTYRLQTRSYTHLFVFQLVYGRHISAPRRLSFTNLQQMS